MILQPATGHHLFRLVLGFLPLVSGLLGEVTNLHLVTLDLSVTIGVELTSLDVDPKVVFDVAYQGFTAGHAMPGLYMVVPGLLRFFFFFLDVLILFCMGFLGSFGLSSSFLPQSMSGSGSPSSH